MIASMKPPYDITWKFKIDYRHFEKIGEVNADANNHHNFENKQN
jgi:hypothetical protein